MTGRKAFDSVCARSLRTQQRAKSQCQITPSAGASASAHGFPLFRITPIRSCWQSESYFDETRRQIDLYGEFDPGSGRTLAACFTHASRAVKPLRGWISGERVSNTWATYP